MKKTKSKWWKVAKAVFALLGCFFLVLMWAWFQVWTSPARASLKSTHLQTKVKSQKSSQKETLRVLTLNLAHGRSDGWSHLFLSKESIQANLSKIAAMLRRENPDVVALQEADGKNWWSGRFHHIHFLAKKAGYPYVAFAPLIHALGIRYGTALLSRHPLKHAYKLRFHNGFPMVGKGVVVASILKPGFFPKPVDIVSVHLDPPRSSMRAKQLKELQIYLKKRGKPAIVVGDFNTEWNAGNNELPRFAKTLNLVAYQPQSSTLKSFPFLNKRLDWILAPGMFQFQKHRHLSEVLSDHKAVVTDLRIKKNTKR